MATVTIQKRKRKSGIKYAVRYKNPITRASKHYATYEKMKDAQAAANDLRAILDSGKKPKSRKNRLRPLRFQEVACLLECEWQTKNTRGDLKPKTMYDYNVWLKQLCDVFGNRLLCEIKKDEIEKFIYDTAKSTSNVNANKHLSTIKKVYKMGIRVNAIVEDVSIEIKGLKEGERNTFLFPHELDNLVRATGSTRAKFYMPAIICLGAEHGASKQEILSLRWRDVQLDKGPDGLIRFFRTKNENERTECIMPRTRQALLDWKTHLEYMRHRTKVSAVKSDHVFCRIDGTPIKNFNRAWWAALKIAGISGFHFHDLRHTFCSNLLMAGGDLKDAKEMIGHSDIAMTDRYSHLSGLHKRNLQKLLSEYYQTGASN
jgi:integrase